MEELVVNDFPDIYQWFEPVAQQADNQQIKIDCIDVNNDSNQSLETGDHHRVLESTVVDVNLSVDMDEPSLSLNWSWHKRSLEEITSIVNYLNRIDAAMTATVGNTVAGQKYVTVGEPTDNHLREFGCTWSPQQQDGECVDGSECQFVRAMLGLDNFKPGGISHTPPSQLSTNQLASVVPPPQRKQRIMLVKQTPKGLMKVTETEQSFTLEQIKYIQQLSPQQQIKCIKDMHQLNERELKKSDLEKLINSYVVPRDPIKVQLESRLVCGLPTPSPSPPAMDTENMPVPNDINENHVCIDCKSKFRDAKLLTKHRRNHHHLYVCKSCGKQVVGYYKMASHSKKEHSKDPIFFCECGRNFGEKKGITKHQNTCPVFRQSHNTQLKSTTDDGALNQASWK